VGIVSIIHIPLLAKIFNHTPLSIWIWMGLGMNTFVLYSIEWMRKAILRGIKNLRDGKTPALSLQEVHR
jgi:hypothetical protein